MDLFFVFLSAVLVNNFVLSRFLGICPFLGVSKKVDTALSMGIAVTFVMSLATAATFLVYHYILYALDIPFMDNIAFVLIMASLVQFVEMVIKKSSPTLYQALGVFLPLMSTNCAILGVALLNISSGYGFITAMVHGIGAGIGFTLAIVLFAGIRERLEYNNIPKAFTGFPIALITAGLMSIAFSGFSGLFYDFMK